MEKLARLYEKTISKEYERENKIFDMDASKNILHIGCGAYPITALTLARFNGGKITAIDRNPRAVKLANQVIKKRNLHDKITIKNGDGTNYSVGEFDTIIVSGCTVPKIDVLENVFDTAQPDSKIIVREMPTASRAVAQCIKSYDNIEFMEKVGNHPFPTSKWESFYLVKK